MSEGPPVYEPGLDLGVSGYFRPSGGTYGEPVPEGGGFKYDEATLHELVKEWRDLAAEYLKDLADAEFIANAQPPGVEYASGDNAQLIRSSGDALTTALKERAAYCENMAAKYVSALGKYATAEERATEDINQQSKGI
ncbi:hypothetical protein DMH01_07060 [Amycolatopsis sp. WAC 04182]|uniref:hypothetical protein n=1 Tax=Amycolatopsis sp. WAC 04182 TaxID=2203198 RepID=UPI000F7A8A4D|nr:hypothetical protein [Amycolatopsis sp. WAC 04182]RSN66225.1 hypothetical protein DMH01_07060 [Amycolatopsis sp. WAC 04182]